MHHQAYYVCSVRILESEGEGVPLICIGSGRTTVSLMEDHVDEFSSFNMLTDMIGASAFGVAWEVWSLVRLRISDTQWSANGC
jgi:hypothetical protein